LLCWFLDARNGNGALALLWPEAADLCVGRVVEHTEHRGEAEGHEKQGRRRFRDCKERAHLDNNASDVLHGQRCPPRDKTQR
jgi:hypothetical protein